MKQYKIKRGGESPLKFTGELIASAIGSCERSDNNYSGKAGRWEELYLYKTKGGKYVAQHIRFSRWQGEPYEVSSVNISGTPEGASEFIRYEVDPQADEQLVAQLLSDAASSDDRFCEEVQ